MAAEQTKTCTTQKKEHNAINVPRKFYKWIHQKLTQKCHCTLPVCSEYTAKLHLDPLNKQEYDNLMCKDLNIDRTVFKLSIFMMKNIQQSNINDV